MLVIEASPSGRNCPECLVEADLHFEHLADAQVKDGCSLNTTETGKIRSSFRLPPLFVGLSDDYTGRPRSRAKGSPGVFGPERDYMDFVINNKILPHWGREVLKYKAYRPPWTTAKASRP